MIPRTITNIGQAETPTDQQSCHFVAGCNLVEYLSIKGLKGFIDKDLVLVETPRRDIGIDAMHRTKLA